MLWQNLSRNYGESEILELFVISTLSFKFYFILSPFASLLSSIRQKELIRIKFSNHYNKCFLSYKLPRLSQLPKSYSHISNSLVIRPSSNMISISLWSVFLHVLTDDNLEL